MRFFNTAGPIRSHDHYDIDPLSRLDLAETLNLIALKKYFVLHAPRLTGKTTVLRQLRANLVSNFSSLWHMFRCATLMHRVGWTPTSC